MARPLRIEYQGGVYHVTSRGNARRSIFKDDQDRRKFLDVLALVNRRYHWICHAYCLMDNHYHLVIETPEGNLAKGMRHLNGVYTQSYNRRHRQLGHILQGRYKAIVIDKDSYLLEVCRYVVLNPTRAKAAERLEQWKWSSYNSTAGHGEAHGCLTTDWVLSHFSSRESQARKQYRDFVRDGIGAGSIYDDVKGQVFLGSEEFIGRIGKRVSKRGSLREVPRVQRYADRPELKRLLSGKQLRKEEQAKEAVERYGYSQKEVADFLGLHYSTISRWINMKSGGDASFIEDLTPENRRGHYETFSGCHDTDCIDLHDRRAARLCC